MRESFQCIENIYLDNINLYNNIDSLRESFFVSHIRQDYSIEYSTVGDFEVDDRFLFEIGGRNKKSKISPTPHPNFNLLFSPSRTTSPLWSRYSR